MRERGLDALQSLRNQPTFLSQLRRFWLSREARVEPLLEVPAEVLTGDGGREAGPAGLEAHDRHGRLPAPVTAGIALVFGQFSEPNHASQRTKRSGRQDAPDGR